MTDWEHCLRVHAHLGKKGSVRCYDIYGPDALAVAITGHCHAMVNENPPGAKIIVGPLWIKRIHENAEALAGQSDPDE